MPPPDGDVPDHSTFSKNRHGRFRESDLLRKLFETVVARCMKEGIVGGEAFAVDASIIVADAHRRRGVAKIEDLDPTSNRAVAEYLSVLDDAAFGGATPVEPKTISPTDPAARYTASANSVAGYAYSDNYLIDLKHAVIMDVEATTTIRQAEVGAAKTMLDRTAEPFDFTPSRLVADGGHVAVRGMDRQHRRALGRSVSRPLAPTSPRRHQDDRRVGRECELQVGHLLYGQPARDYRGHQLHGFHRAFADDVRT